MGADFTYVHDDDDADKKIDDFGGLIMSVGVNERRHVLSATIVH